MSLYLKHNRLNKKKREPSVFVRFTYKLNTYKPSKCVAIWKYTINDRASTMVVMKGLAITAGSKPIFFARIGNVQPIILAIRTVITNVEQTTKATFKPT